MANAKQRANEGLVGVYVATSEIEARMVQEVLANAGIRSIVNAEFAPGILPARVGVIAEQEILVLESAAPEARRILTELPGPAPNPSDDEGSDQ